MKVGETPLSTEMRNMIHFILDKQRKVNVVIQFVEYLKNKLNVVDNFNNASTLVNFLIYEDIYQHVDGKRCINFDCSLVERLEIVEQCNDSLLWNYELPGDYLFRLADGHGNQSSPCRVKTQEDFSSWLELSQGRDYIVQKFIDTKIGEHYYSGRIVCIGNELLPLHSIKANHWNTNLHAGHVIEFREDEKCLEMIPNYRNTDEFWNEVFDMFQTLKLELGFIDFSLKDNELIVWEATPAVVFESVEEISPMTSYKKYIIDTVCDYLDQE